MVHYAQEGSLKDLSLDQRGLHRDYRLVRERDLAFAHRVDVAGELQRGEVLAEFCIFIARKELLVEIRFGLAEVHDALDGFIGAAHDGPVVVFRGFSVEHVEDGDGILPAGFVEGFAHRVLVLVGAVGEVFDLDSVVWVHVFILPLFTDCRDGSRLLQE